MHRPRMNLATMLLCAMGFGLPPAVVAGRSALGGYAKRGGGSAKASQRAAAKRRNVIRNRNAHKGK